MSKIIEAYAIDHVICTGGNCTAQGPCYYKEVCPTMKAGGVHSVAIAEERTFTEASFGGFSETDVSGNLRNSGGSYGGGSESLVVAEEERTYQTVTGPLCASGYSKLGTQEAANDMFVVENAEVSSSVEKVAYQTVTGPLTARDYKGAGNEYAEEDKLVVDDKEKFIAKQHHGRKEDSVSGPLTCGQNNTVRGDRPLVCDKVSDGMGAFANWDGEETTGTITARNAGGGQRMPDKANFMCVTNSLTVRRLTPTECERLQGFPDGWTNIGEWTDTKGKLHKESDSARYKALGNSIALPFWFYLMRRISATYERTATLGSLFDGIGGFPLCWIRCNGTKSVLWSSEIEEFPIAVLKKHFGDEDEGITGDVKEYL